MPAEDSFWLLVATIDRYMNGYFTDLSQLRVDSVVFSQLLKDFHPKLADHLDANSVTPLLYMTQWYLAAFTTILPWPSVLRVWDIFYLDGVKVFYHVGLAIMDICKDHLLRNCPTSTELLDFLLHIPHSYLEPDTLFPAVFKVKLSKADLTKYTQRAQHSDSSLGNIPDVLENGMKNLSVSDLGYHQSSSSLSSSPRSNSRNQSSTSLASSGVGSIGRSFMRKTGSHN
jgi:hypothetical protein